MAFQNGDEHVHVRRKPENKKEKLNPEAVQHLLIDTPKRISQGGIFSRDGIYQANARYSNDRKSRNIPVVVKFYTYWQEGMLEKTMQRYRAAKAAGLRVPRTVRFDPERHMTIMTDFNGENNVALSSRNFSDLIEDHSVSELPGFEGVARTMFDDAYTAADKKISIALDCYFLLIPRSKGESIDYVIGDLDVLRQAGDEDAPGREFVHRYNFNNTRDFLEEFCGKWLEDGKLEHYLGLLRPITREAEIRIRERHIE